MSTAWVTGWLAVTTRSQGGIVAVGSMLAAGGAVIVRERFSSSHFWLDVAASKATIVQYIGELCRYLLATPATQSYTKHQVRLAVGNGLSEEVWLPFQERFAIPRILEFYAASEGAVSFTNCEGKVGALGRVPGFLSDRFSVALIECDRDTGELLALQDEITSQIAVTLNLELIGAEAARSTDHPDALDYILRGRAALSKPMARDNYVEAIGLFERASALDPR